MLTFTYRQLRDITFRIFQAAGAPADELSNRVILHLSNQAAAERDQPRTWLAAAA